MKVWVDEYVNVLKKAGFNVEPFCLTLDPPNSALTFYDLNQSWINAEKKLMKMYQRLEEKIAEGFDILVNGVGINLHPEFVKQLPIFTVFCCADDPENSANLSKPAAFAYDLSLVCNIAELDTYRSWGVKNVEWLPIGLWPRYYEPLLTDSKMLESLSKRDVDLFLIGDKNSAVRKERMEKLDKAFPQAHFFGNGWAKGLLPLGEEVSYMMRSKIGPNVHNSTGPINLRLYTLPANGVMQICDNKKGLGKIYELGKEAVGYDSIEECIDLCKYYLDHDKERIEIAFNGWKRAMKDYTEERVFDRIISAVDNSDQKKNTRERDDSKEIAVKHKRKIFYRTIPRKIVSKSKQLLKTMIGKK